MNRFTLALLKDKVRNIIGNSYILPITTDKGIAGKKLEELTGIPTSSACLDCIDGELKVFPVKRLKNGALVPKETIAITMLDYTRLRNESFEESNCYKKISNMLIVPYLRENDTIEYMKPTHITSDSCKGFEVIKNDYNILRQYVLEGKQLSGSIGELLQTRTKGNGGNSPKTRAFYLRKEFMTLYVPLIQQERVQQERVQQERVQQEQEQEQEQK